MAREAPTEQQIKEWTRTLRNWGRWGEDDELGTMNYVTAEKRRAAAALVREGVTVSCARRIVYDVDPDTIQPLRHFMTSSGEAAHPENQSGSSDVFLIGPHGYTITHVDALSHIFWQGQMYNNRPAKLVTTRDGATSLSIEALGDGVVSRGVLLDITKLKGKKWLEPGEGVFPEDLEAAEEAQGVRVESGDILLVRTGHLRRRNEEGPRAAGEHPGLQAACLPWLHERQVAMIGCDSANDAFPSGYNQPPMPIHVVGIVSMGLWLLDNANHEELAAACERFNRWAFLLVIAPLKLKNGTGCPVNPIAIF
jgi:kynurenine formamidase